MAKANPFRFSTKYQDDETDLLYYGYRYYNASTGRWISRDPAEEPGCPNYYSFVQNRPTASTDPDGRFTITWDASQFTKRPCGGWDAHWLYNFGDLTEDSYLITEVTITIAWIKCNQKDSYSKQITYYEAVPQPIKKGDQADDHDSMSGYPETIGGGQYVLGDSRTFKATALVNRTVQSWRSGAGTIAPDMKISATPPVFWNWLAYLTGEGIRYSAVDKWRCCCPPHDDGEYRHNP